MAKKVTKNNGDKNNPITDQNAQTQYVKSNKENPVIDENAQTQYVKSARENPLLDENAQTQYVKSLRDNSPNTLSNDDLPISYYSKIEDTINTLNQIISVQFPNANDDSKSILVGQILNKLL